MTALTRNNGHLADGTWFVVTRRAMTHFVAQTDPKQGSYHHVFAHCVVSAPLPDPRWDCQVEGCGWQSRKRSVAPLDTVPHDWARHIVAKHGLLPHEEGIAALAIPTRIAGASGTEPTNPMEAVTLGLILALTAPTDEKAQACAAMSSAIAASAGLSDEELEQCKDDARKHAFSDYVNVPSS